MNFSLTVVLAEISLLLLTVVTVIAIKAFKRRCSDQEAVNTLVISIKTNQPARVEKLAGILKDTSQLSDDDALNKANELIKKQNKFYQDAIDLYFTRNNAVLSKLDNRLEDLLDQYQGLLKVSNGDETSVDSGAVEQLSKDIAALSRELEELRAENASLSNQLKAAENELDHLGREYVMAFNKPRISPAKESAGNAGPEEDGKGETTPGQQAAAVGEPANISLSSEEGEKAVPKQSGDEHIAIVEPGPSEPVSSIAAKKAPDSKLNESTANTAADLDAIVTDDPDDGLLADLGLDELIGDQPALQAAAVKSAAKQ